MLRLVGLMAACFVGGAASLALSGADPPPAHAGPVAGVSATCADHATQADAQRARDTRDADGDGVYCESLPCPCAEGGSGDGDTPEARPDPAGTGCTRPGAVQRIGFSRSRYPGIRKHYAAAVQSGWPRVLVVNRPDASARRDRLLQDHRTRDGYDRDEYPPAVGRGRGKGLTRGSNPRGWKADVDYVGSSENRSHGARLGVKLRRFCNGTRFRYIFY